MEAVRKVLRVENNSILLNDLAPFNNTTVEVIVLPLAERRPEVRQDILNIPVLTVGVWPETLSLHREDMYGDDGR